MQYILSDFLVDSIASIFVGMLVIRGSTLLQRPKRRRRRDNFNFAALDPSLHLRIVDGNEQREYTGEYVEAKEWGRNALRVHVLGRMRFIERPWWRHPEGRETHVSSG